MIAFPHEFGLRIVEAPNILPLANLSVNVRLRVPGGKLQASLLRSGQKRKYLTVQSRLFHRRIVGKLHAGGEHQRSPDWRIGPVPVWRGAEDGAATPPCSFLRLGPSAAVSMSPASRSFASGGCPSAFSNTCPVFPGPRNSFFPPGNGRLNGFRVLLVMSMSILNTAR